MRLSREKAARWIAEIAELSDTRQRQFCGLLALEHLDTAGIEGMLAPLARSFLIDFATQSNLQDYLPASLEGSVGRVEQVPSDTLLLRQALRAINDRLTDTASETIIDEFAAVIDALTSRQSVVAQYYRTVASVLCRHDRSEDLLALDRKYHWDQYSESDRNWELGLGIVSQALNGRAANAADLVYKISKRLDQGWINTEFIHFAVREIIRQKAAGKIDWWEIEKFHYAVISLLDAYNGEWFSRLHDRDLIKATVALFDIWPTHTNHFRDNLVEASIRNFGLCPDFWRILDERHPRLENLQLQCARHHAKCVQAVLEAGLTTEVGVLEPVAEAVRYFQRMRNREATFLLREMVMKALPALNQKMTPAGHMLISMLLENPAEAVRLAAFPLSAGDHLQEQFPVCGEHLMKVLRRLGSDRRSIFFDAQCEASRLIGKASEAARINDTARQSRCLAQLHALALHLDNWESGFLGAEVLAWVCNTGGHGGLSAGETLTALARNHRQGDPADRCRILPASAGSECHRQAGRPAAARR